MAVNFHISKDGNLVTIRHIKDSFDLQTPETGKFLNVPRYQEDFNTQTYHLTASNPTGDNIKIVGPDGRVIINAVPYTALKTGAGNSAIGGSAAATVSALNGASFFGGSSVDADISSNTSAHTANASNITSLQTTVTSEQAKVLALQNTIKSLSGDRGIYITNAKDENSSKVKLTATSARLQAGSKTSIDIDESSPGTLTFEVAAGTSGSEVATTALTISGNASGRTTHDFVGDTIRITSNSSGSGARIFLTEGTDNGTNSLALAAPNSLTAATTLTFPDGAGSNGQVLSTDGSGTLSWINAGLSAIHAQASDILKLQSNQIGVSTNLTTTIGADRLLFYDHSATKLTALELGTNLSITGTTLNASSGGIASLAADTSPQLGGDLDVDGNKITSSGNGDIVIDPAGTGGILLKSDNIKLEGSGTVTMSSLKFYEATALDGNYVALKAPLSITSDVTWTLPGADGTANQVLKTNGSGTLSFTTVVSATNPVTNGTVSVKPVGGLPAGVKIFDNDESHGVRLLAPDMTSDFDLTLPATDGSAGQFLKTDGSGNLSFASAGGGGGNHFLGQAGGRFHWSAADDGEVVALNSTYGYSYYLHSTEPETDVRTYDASDTIDSTTGTAPRYVLGITGFKLTTTDKKVKCTYSFRLQNAPANSTWGISMWSGDQGTTGQTGNATITLRGRTADITQSTNSSIRLHHGSFTTTSAITEDRLVFYVENRSGSLTTNTYMYGTFKFELVD